MNYEMGGLITSADVCARTGLSYRRLMYWRKRGLIEAVVQVRGSNRASRRGRIEAATGSGTTLLWEPEVVDEIKELLDRIHECPLHHEEVIS